MAPPWLATAIVVFVSIVWGAAGLVGAATSDYEFLQLVTPAMLIALGYAVGVKVIRDGNGKRKNGDDG